MASKGKFSSSSAHGPAKGTRTSVSSTACRRSNRPFVPSVSILMLIALGLRRSNIGQLFATRNFSCSMAVAKPQTEAMSFQRIVPRQAFPQICGQYGVPSKCAFSGVQKLAFGSCFRCLGRLAFYGAAQRDQSRSNSSLRRQERSKYFVTTEAPANAD